jgi:hypothetical protein
MRTFVKFYLKDETKKVETIESEGYYDVESKLKEKYPNFSRITYRNVVENGQDGFRAGSLMLANQ